MSLGALLGVSTCVDLCRIQDQIVNCGNSGSYTNLKTVVSGEDEVMGRREFHRR